MDKKSFSERDICSKIILPAVAKAGWDMQRQIREEVTFTKGRVIVRGKLHTRGTARRADVVLYHAPNRPIAVIEAKDNQHGVGEPVYTYSLKQGIEDGFLAPYKVVRIDFDRDLQGWRPPRGMLDKNGQPIEDRIYNLRDMDRQLVLEMRTLAVATKITQFLKASDSYTKTIVFCDDIDHAERMRQALVNLNAERVKENRKYVMRITGDDAEGKAELDNFIDPESRYPVIATTSKLMTTGVDAQTCKLIVLDQHIKSMTEFKQIIGRGTRINEDYGKFSLAAVALQITDGTHHTPTYVDDGTPFISVKDLDGETVSFDDCRRIPHEEHVAINERCKPLLTGDGRLRKQAAKDGLEVRGALWLLDQLVAHDIIATAHAAAALQAMLDAGARLPPADCAHRLAAWQA